MNVTFVQIIANNKMLHPNAPEYANIVIAAKEFTPSIERYGKFKCIVADKYVVYGNLQLCDDCEYHIADRFYHGYRLCIHCARQLLQYTPPPTHTIKY